MKSQFRNSTTDLVVRNIAELGGRGRLKLQMPTFGNRVTVTLPTTAFDPRIDFFNEME